MRMSVLFHFILFQTIRLIAGKKDCDLTQFNNKLLVVSNKAEVSEDAGNICSSSGGSLAQISSTAERKQIDNFLRKNLIPSGLDIVKIYDVPNEENTHKYRPPFSVKDPASVTDWPRPEKGELRAFFLYKNQKFPFATLVKFCYVTPRDFLRYDCNGGSDGWNFNYKLYGGNNTTPNTIILYAYYNSHPHSTVLFLNDSVSNPDLIKQSGSNFVSEIYIPDISVFIGARSNVSQKKWYWNNNTEVNNPMFPESNSSLCQQMTYPLTYNNGINLHPKQCNKKAYFACQFTFNIEASAVPCNGSVLTISWNQYNFSSITGKTNDYPIIIKVFKQNKSNKHEEKKQIKFNENQQTIMGLKKQTTYDIELRSKSCDNSLLSSASATTSFGAPDPVQNPRVVNESMDDCIIEWKYPDKQQRDNIQHYMVYYYFPTSKSYKVLKDKLKVINGFYKYDAHLFEIPSNSTVVFKIQAFSCEGGSEIRNVSGSCIPPHHGGSSQNQSTTFIIVAVSSCFLVVGVIILVYKIFKKIKIDKSASNTSTNPEHTRDENVSTTTRSVHFRNQEELNIPSQSKPDLEVYENVSKLKKSNDLENLKSFYIKESLNEFKSLQNKFDELNKKCLKNEPNHEVAGKVENAKKNRYKNIYPYDTALVTLSNQGYINASYIEGSCRNRSYIATQGPKPETVSNFWEMVWKENSLIIVMLCKCVEKMKTKCEMYWPALGRKTDYGLVTVSCKTEKILGGIIKREMRISNQNNERTITQFHYVSWPDHDIPLTTSGMYRLRNLVNNEHAKNQSKGRIIVHCSAGVGRTGTYIAIDNLIEEFHETGKVDVYNAVMKMRRNRKDMVQNKNQYVFIYKILLESLMFTNTEKLSKEFAKTNQTKTISKEFENLFSLTSPEVKQNENSIYENFSPKILSNDVNRVKITKEGGRTVLMDAHYIENDRYPSCFIASSGPHKGKEEDFVDVIVNENMKIVVCLENLSSDPLTSSLQRQNDFVQIGSHCLTLEEITDFKGFYLKKILVKKSNPKSCMSFSIIQFQSWKEDLSPPSMEYLADAFERIKSSMISNQYSKALVYCRDGRSRTGLFLALANLIEQIKSTDTVDVFRTVKDLREMRPGAFDSLEFYQLCYQKTLEYLSRYR